MMRFEWLIMEFMVLGLLIAELISLRRSQARDRAAREAKDSQPRSPEQVSRADPK